MAASLPAGRQEHRNTCPSVTLSPRPRLRCFLGGTGLSVAHPLWVCVLRRKPRLAQLRLVASLPGLSYRMSSPSWHADEAYWGPCHPHPRLLIGHVSMQRRTSGEDQRLPSPTSALPINQGYRSGRGGSLSLPLFQVNGSKTLLIGETGQRTESSKTLLKETDLRQTKWGECKPRGTLRNSEGLDSKQWSRSRHLHGSSGPNHRSAKLQRTTEKRTEQTLKSGLPV